MDRDGVHLRLVGQAVCQRLPALIAGGLAKDAAASPGSRTHGTRVHIGRLGHYALQPSVATLPNYTPLSDLVTKLHRSAFGGGKREVVANGAKPRSVWRVVSDRCEERFDADEVHHPRQIMEWPALPLGSSKLPMISEKGL